MRTFVLALASALALGACATEGGAQSATVDRDCFFASQVSGYTVVDDHNVQVRAGTGLYVLTTLFNARQLDWSQAIALRSATGSICTGTTPGVDIIGGEPVRTYPVQSIARVPTPTEGS